MAAPSSTVDRDLPAGNAAQASTSRANSAEVSRGYGASLAVRDIASEMLAFIERPTDPNLTALGLRVWERCRGDYMTGVAGVIAEMYPEGELGPLAMVNLQLLQFAGAWADGAFQRIETAHSYAAALACSDASKDALGDIEVGWPGFLVHVPEGLIRVVEGPTDLSVDRIGLRVGTSQCAMILWTTSPRFGAGEVSFVPFCAPNMAELLFADPETSHRLPGVSDSEMTCVGRALVVCKRIVAGLLLALQHQDNFRTRECRLRSSSGSRRDGAPLHRVTIVGRPLRVDCRPAVRHYLAGVGGCAPASLQCLVRGHYRRQVIGIGRGGRKVIWVEPYWRGPEDAPILTKPCRLGGDK